MRKRHSPGGVKKQRGSRIGIYWVDGARKSKTLGFVKDLSKTQVKAGWSRKSGPNARRTGSGSLASSSSRSIFRSTASSGSIQRGRTM